MSVSLHPSLPLSLARSLTHSTYIYAYTHTHAHACARTHTIPKLPHIQDLEIFKIFVYIVVRCRHAYIHTTPCFSPCLSLCMSVCMCVYACRRNDVSAKRRRRKLAKCESKCRKICVTTEMPSDVAIAASARLIVRGRGTTSASASVVLEQANRSRTSLSFQKKSCRWLRRGIWALEKSRRKSSK